MGPTRDMDPNEQCHCCAREGLGITQARVVELERALAQIVRLNCACDCIDHAQTIARTALNRKK